MELTQLKYFAMVAEELHFGNAARKLNITQPPLSVQIRNLEEELGVALFRRTSRSVSLTEEGKVFLKEVGEILFRAENAATRVRSLSGSSGGPLKIGFNEPSINRFLPSLIKDFRKRNPDTVIALNEMESSHQPEALAQDRIDIGFARLYEAAPAGIERIVRLFRELSHSHAGRL